MKHPCERLIATLEKARGRDLSDSIAALLQAVQDWCGPDGAGDDLSVLAFQIE